VSGRGRIDDERLARWLAAGVAPADPATLARALARLGESEREPAWLAWLARPRALAAAASLLVVCVAAGVWYGDGDNPRASSAAGGGTTVSASSDLLGSLLADEGAASAGAGGVRDSGGVR